MIVGIIAKDTKQQCNIALVKWLEQNLAVLVKAGVRFKFKIAEKSDASALKEKGIDKLPAMIIGSKVYMGNLDIQKQLAKLLERPEGFESDHEQDQLRSWQMGEMSKTAAERDRSETDDDSKSTGEELVRRATEVAEQRKKQHSEERKKTTVRQESKRPDNIVAQDDIKRLAGSADSDERLMARLFEQTL